MKKISPKLEDFPHGPEGRIFFEVGKVAAAATHLHDNFVPPPPPLVEWRKATDKVARRKSEEACVPSPDRLKQLQRGAPSEAPTQPDSTRLGRRTRATAGADRAAAPAGPQTTAAGGDTEGTTREATTTGSERDGNGQRGAADASHLHGNGKK